MLTGEATWSERGCMTKTMTTGAWMSLRCSKGPDIAGRLIGEAGARKGSLNHSCRAQQTRFSLRNTCTKAGIAWGLKVARSPVFGHGCRQKCLAWRLQAAVAKSGLLVNAPSVVPQKGGFGSEHARTRHAEIESYTLRSP